MQSGGLALFAIVLPVMRFEFSGVVFEWRGPAPFYFVATPEEVAREIEGVKRELSYGWGVVPVTITLGSISAKTSLIPRDGGFLVPLKDALRKPNSLNAGDQVTLSLEI